MGRGWLTAERSLVRFVNRNDANGYYEALGLSPNASREDIKAAYRRLVKTVHPDRGGDEELFLFITEIANVLLDGESKVAYDSVGRDALYIGNMERAELARRGLMEAANEAMTKPCSSHWACFTNSGFPPNEDTDAWIDFCREVSPAVGYRGKIRVGIVEGGPSWPGDPAIPWGILSVGYGSAFVIFQRGIKPNRLQALCAMIDWQNYLLKQIRVGYGS